MKGVAVEGEASPGVDVAVEEVRDGAGAAAEEDEAAPRTS